MARRLSNRTRIAFAVAASIVPAALIAAMLVGYDSYDRERARVIRDTTATARALIATVDGELKGVRSALLALATSPYLATDDFARFHAQASAALKYQDLNNLVLIDATGQQRVNTLRPYGAALPAQGNPEQLLAITRTGTPVIADLFEGPVAKRYLLAVGVPVRRDGAVRYSLNAGIAPASLAEVLARQHLPEGWIASIFDTTGTIVARTHNAERFVGAKGAPALVQRLKEPAPEGWLETDTVEDTPVVSVYSRSPESGWAIAIGIPQAELLRHLWFSMARLAILAFVLLGTALALALWIGTRLGAEEAA